MEFLIIDDDTHFTKILSNEIKEVFLESNIILLTSLDQLGDINNKFDVIFLDVMVNNVMTTEYVLELKNKYPEAVIVFISTFSNLIFNTQFAKPLCFIRKSNFKEDFKVFYNLYKIEKKHNLYLKFELDKTIDKHSMDYVQLLLEDIIYVECFNHELIIHTYRNEYVVKLSLKKFFMMIKNVEWFVQTHKAYAVNLNYVYKINNDSINMLDELSKNEVQLGRRYKKEFKKKFKEYMKCY